MASDRGIVHVISSHWSPDRHLLTNRHVTSQLALSAFENADTPLHLVMVDILGLGNMAGAAAPPLFQAMFFLHDSEWLEGFQLEGISVDVPRRIEKNVARCVRACVRECVRACVFE